MDIEKIEMLKGIKTRNVAGFIHHQTRELWQKKKTEYTLTKINFLKSSLTAVVISYAAYLLKEEIVASSYLEFMKSFDEDENIKALFEIALEDVWSIVVETEKRFSKKELLAYTLFNYFADENFHLNQSISTPKSIVELSRSILDIKDSDKVLTLYSCDGNFVRDCYLNNKNASYKGIEQNYITKGVSDIRMSILGSDIYSELSDPMEFESKDKYDKVFSNNEFAPTKTKRESIVKKYANLANLDESIIRKCSSNWIVALSIIKNLDKSGKGISIVLGRDLWSITDADIEIRKHLVESGCIEAIIALPKKMYCFTTVPVYMVVYSNNNKEISMIDATNFGKEYMNEVSLDDSDISKILQKINTNSDISKTVTVEEISKKDYLLDPVKYLEVLPKFENSIKLEDLAIDISRGDQLRPSEIKDLITKEETAYRYLRLADIKDGYIEFNDEYLTQLPEGREKYLAKNNLVVITRLGHPNFRSAVIELNGKEDILISGHFIMIELDETKVNPVYVQAFLASDIGAKFLKSISTGSVHNNISLKNLKSLKIPMPSRTIQDRIALEYMTTIDKIKLLQLKLKRNQKALKHIYEEGYFA